MALEIIRNISVDFHDNKYVLINAKQYDDSSRWIAITCYNQGDLYNLSSSKHSAYVKYRKADGHGVINYCRINYKGEVLVELTEQMLAVGGICYVDLVIINKGSAIVNVDTGEIITIDDTPILSTMAFCVNVYETAIDNSEIESSYEYDALNNLMQRAEADYNEVILLSKSYAVGNANNIRENENFDNAKYYSEQAHISADKAKVSEENALVSEQNAKTSETNASTSESHAKTSETNAKTSEENAKTSETNAATSEQNAKTSETNAATSEENAYDYSIVAQRYAVGGTNTAYNEEVDNAKYYYTEVTGIRDSISGGFFPKGTVYFAELATIEKFTGYMYIVEDSFTTDDTFVEGAGVDYPAGTIVYYTVDNLWDCFDGIKTSIASVDEVKSYLAL